MWFVMNLQARKQSKGACGNGWWGGIRQSIEKMGMSSYFDHFLVWFWVERLDKATNPPPCIWTIIFSTAGFPFGERQSLLLQRTRTVMQFYLFSKILKSLLKTPSQGMQILKLDFMLSNASLEKYLAAPSSPMFHIFCPSSMVGVRQNLKLLNLAESLMIIYLGKERPKVSFLIRASSQSCQFNAAEVAMCSNFFIFLYSFFICLQSSASYRRIFSHTLEYCSLGLLVMSFSILKLCTNYRQHLSFVYISTYQTILPFESRGAASLEWRKVRRKLKYVKVDSRIIGLSLDLKTSYQLHLRILEKELRNYWEVSSIFFKQLSIFLSPDISAIITRKNSHISR